ncbi:MAG TPA: BamA/TamA family outer membrane protein [Longimicrobiales bacterium]
MRQRLLLLLALFASVHAILPAVAAAQFFGRNKVQYRSFDFQIIETAHFDVYFYEEEREAALDAARMAERAYARLSKLLQHEFKEKKPIIVYASHAEFQQTNTIRDFVDESTGAFAEVLKSRVVIPLTGSYAEFDHVLRHELVHSFQHDIMFRNAAIDNANPFANQLPLWFTEGMAEYLAIGHIDAITAAWLRDASLSGYLRTIGEMNRRHDYLSYRFGQALWAYIGSKWGDEVIGILLQRATRIGLARAFESTLGMSLAELSQEWTAAVRKTYLPQVAEFDRPETFARPILRHRDLYEDPSYLAPAISPDGKKLAVFSQREGFFPDLWLYDIEKGEFERRLVESSREADFESLRYSSSSASFSPDGRYLAFAAQTGGRDALYIYDLERNRLDRKLEYGLSAIMNPTWSPDGRQIAFSGIDGGLTDLFITDLDGNLRRLTNDRYANLFPSWSPDGRSIAFSTDQAPGTDFETLSYSNLRVALYHLDTGEIELLPHQDVGKNINPVWSPDSRSLIWVSDRTGTKDLYLFNRDEGQLYRITRMLSGSMGPTATDMSPTLAWARGSGRLVFVYFEAGGHSVFALDDPVGLQRVAVADVPTGESAVPLAGGGADDPDDGAPPAASGTVLAAVDSVDQPTSSLSFYRSGNDFRPSERLPEGAAAPAPISVMALLDSADFALPDTADFRITDYKVRFSPDIIGRPTIGAQVGGYYGNGVYGGSYISLSDMLGNHNILLAGSVNGSFSDATFFTGYNFLKRRANFGIALSQVPLYRYYGSFLGDIDLDGQAQTVVADQFVRDVYRSVDAVISYPFSTFRRVELGATGAIIQRDLLLRGINLSRSEPLDEDIGLDDWKFFQPSAALVFDNTFFGYTGPIIGRRYRIQLSRTVGDFDFNEALIDFRNYLNFKRKVVFATQFLALTRIGADADNFSLYWGGPYFLRGYDGDSFNENSPECSGDLGGGNASLAPCPARYQLIGSSAALLRTELRFPIITELQIGFLGNFPPVDAVLFFDGGIAWDNQLCAALDAIDRASCADARDVKLVWHREPGQDPVLYREPLFSYGVGLRINVFYTVLRLDYAFPLSRPDRSGVFSVSFGPSF